MPLFFYIVGVPGADLDTGLSMSIVDDNAFDDIAPNITLPSAQSLLDSIKFSPRSALLMLNFIDSEYIMKLLHVQLLTSCLLEFLPFFLIHKYFSYPGLLVEALRNKAFEANIPIMDTSLRKIFSFAKAFSNRLFEFFVKVCVCDMLSN